MFQNCSIKNPRSVQNEFGNPKTDFPSYMKGRYDKFMTEKEKTYVAACLARNIKRPPKFFDYSIFFHNKKETQKKIQTPKSENTKTAEFIEKREQHRHKIRELFETSLCRTSKKSKKAPRPINSPATKRLSERLETSLKIEQLFYRLICLKHNVLIKLVSKETLNELKENEIESVEYVDLKSKIDASMIDYSLFCLSEIDFLDCISSPKFYTVMTEIFNNVNNQKVKMHYLGFLITHSSRIEYRKCYSDMLDSSYRRFPIMSVAYLLNADFFKNFYFSLCNVHLGKNLILSSKNYANAFYKYLVNEDLEMLFNFEDEAVAWEFLAVFMKILKDEQKSKVVELIKDQVAESLINKNTDTLVALNEFLDSIGISYSDLDDQ